MSKLDAKREEIAAMVAAELGLGDLATLSASERAVVDQQTTETIEGCGDDTPGASDCSDATLRLRHLLAEYRALAELRADELNTRLAAEGEVFSPEDDA